MPAPASAAPTSAASTTRGSLTCTHERVDHARLRAGERAAERAEHLAGRDAHRAERHAGHDRREQPRGKQRKRGAGAGCCGEETRYLPKACGCSASAICFSPRTTRGPGRDT